MAVTFLIDVPDINTNEQVVEAMSHFVDISKTTKQDGWPPDYKWADLDAVREHEAAKGKYRMSIRKGDVVKVTRDTTLLAHGELLQCSQKRIVVAANPSAGTDQRQFDWKGGQWVDFTSAPVQVARQRTK